MANIPLNGPAPLGYRITTRDRSGSTAAPDNFILLNQTDNDVFEAEGGTWESTSPFPAYLLDAWFATIPGIAPPGQGYRIGTSDRSGPTATPNNFIVINTTNNKVFQVQSGSWVDVTGSFDPTTLANLITAWTNA